MGIRGSVCAVALVAAMGSTGLALRAGGTPSAAEAFPPVIVDLEGEAWTPERVRGRVVLLDFWATWCAPCLAELPRLKQLRARHAREDFEIIGVMLEASDRRTLVSWLNRHRIDWPQVHERGVYGGALARTFDVNQLPETVLFDRDGSIAARGLRGELLASRVAALVENDAGAGRSGGVR